MTGLRQMKIIALLLTVGTSVGCESFDSVRDFGHRTGQYFTHTTPINAAVQMEDTRSADARRVGVNRLADERFGRRDPYTRRYGQISQFDIDWLVRATAIRALNRSRDASSTGLYIRGLNDENDIVRVESAKALVHMPDPNAVSTLLQRVNDPNENRDVRIWSAQALQNYRTLEVARTLANQLSSREFGVAWQAHQSLTYLTGQDLRYDETAWLEYFTGPQKPFG